MPSFLIECYVPMRPRAVEDALAAANRTAELSTGVSYVRTTYVPDDETCFHAFDAPSSAVLGEAAQRAALRHLRIVEAVETAPSRGESR